MSDPVTPEIQESHLSSPPTEPLTVTPKKPFPFLLFILIILLVIISGFVAYLFSQNMLLKQKLAEAQLVPTPSPTLSIGADIFADWKSYTNTSFHYSIKYPNDWKANSISPGIGTMPLDDVQRGLLLTPPASVSSSGMGIQIEDIHIQIEADSRQTSGETFEEWINTTKKNLGNTTISITESKIASFKTTVIKTGFKIIYLLSSPDKTKFIFIETQTPTSEYREIIDQILSTFKFINPSISSKNGTVTGKVCYPSEGIPAGIVRAKNISTQEITSKNHPQNTGTFSMELSAGTYIMRFEPGGTDAYPGYHTGCSGVEQYCNDTEIRSSIQISVVPGNVIQDVKLCDFYYPASSQPDF